MASSFRGTYTAGRYLTATDDEAIEKARDDYARSATGRDLKDVGAFRFWVASGSQDSDD